MRARILITVAILCSLLAVDRAAGAQADQRCFAETGYCIEGRIRSFWEQGGGLPVFGLPIAPQRRACALFAEDELRAALPGWRGCAAELAEVAGELRAFDVRWLAP